MLPKLASIHKRARLVFIIATNNISDFDLAIRRPGRFDRIVQIMPPTYEAKLSKKDWGTEADIDLKQKLGDLDTKSAEKLAELTYLECDAFASQLAKVADAEMAKKILDDHWKRCTMQSLTADNKTTWKDRCKKEERFNRVD